MSRRQTVAWGSAGAVALAAVSAALINELHDGWGWWVGAATAVAASVFLAWWLAARTPGPSDDQLPVGAFDRLGDAIFDPTPLAEEPDLPPFTGRSWLIREIDSAIATLRMGYVVIQGEAGVGKTALAAHLVRERSLVHHFTQLAGARSPEQARRSLAAQLIGRWRLEEEFAPGDVLPAGADRPDWLLKVLYAAASRRDRSKAGEPLVLVVDGLDEADPATPGGDTGIPLGLPRPEHLPDNVFVVATSRYGPPLAALHQRASWLSIPMAGEDNLRDLREYLSVAVADPAGRLAATVSAHGVQRQRFVDMLMERCGGLWIYVQCVLYAMLTDQLAPTDLEDLPAALAGYYLEQIGRWRHANRWESVGLPALATLAAWRRPVSLAELRLSTGVNDGDAISAWLQSLRPFLNVARVAGALVYEIRHESLRDLFRRIDTADANAYAGVDDMLRDAHREAHRRLVDLLAPPLVDGARDWSSVDAYARMALPEHAALGGRLDELIVDGGFLLSIAPSAVLRWRPALTSDDGLRSFDAYELSLGEAHGGSYSRRAFCLHAWARKVRADALAVSAAQLSGEDWVIGRAWWTGISHQAMPGHAGMVIAVAVGRLGRTDVVVSGGEDGWVRVWDPDSTTSPTDLYRHGAPVLGVAIGRVGDSDVIASVGNDTLRLWDSHRSNEPRTVGPCYGWTSLAFDEIGGRGVLLYVHQDTVLFWDVEARAHLPSLFCPGGVESLAVGRIGGRPVIATGSTDGVVRLWDAEIHELKREFAGHERVGLGDLVHIPTLAVGRVDGREVVVSGGKDGTVRLWDPIGSREPLMSPAQCEDVRSVAICKMNARDVIVAAGQTRVADDLIGRVIAWDPTDGDAGVRDLITYEPPPNGGLATVWAVATGRIGGRTVVAAAGGKGRSVRVTTIDGPRETTARWGRVDEHTAVAIGLLSRRDVIVSGGKSGDIHVLDPTGDTEPMILPGHAGPVWSVAVGSVLDEDLIVSADNHTVRIWNLREPNDPAVVTLPAREGEWESLYGYHIHVAIGPVGGINTIAVASDDGVRILDPQGHITDSDLWPGEKHLALGRLQGRDVIVVASNTTMRIYAAREPMTVLSYADLGGVAAVAVGRFASRGVIVLVADGALRIWDTADAAIELEYFTVGEHPVWEAVLGVVDGRELLVSSGASSVLRIWEWDSRQETTAVRWKLGAHEGPIEPLAIGKIAGRDAVIAGHPGGTLLLWTPNERLVRS